MALTCFEAGFGGAAGGGKTDAMLIDAIWAISQKRGYGVNYRALVLRRTITDLKKWLEPRSHQIYPRLGGRYNKNEYRWTFPGDEVVFLGGAERERDIEAYKGAPYQYVAFDELDMFSEYQYMFMISRLRSSIGVPCYLRSGINPPPATGNWIRRRFAPWVGLPRSERHGAVGTPWAKDGQVLHFEKGADGSEVMVERPSRYSISRTFVHSKLSDNPALSYDGAYERGLRALDRVTRARLLDGDFDIDDNPGELFRREWFPVVGAPPVDALCLRVWDRAATEPSPNNPDPDWTVGVKLSINHRGRVYVEDVRRFRLRPHGVMEAVVHTAQQDGTECAIGIICDPGQAGKADAAAYVTALHGYPVKVWREEGDKTTRARPYSAQCEAGNVSVVRGIWNDAYFCELEAFPGKAHDDQVDASSMAYTQLVTIAHRMGWITQAV